jgi:hypothetical protein
LSSVSNVAPTKRESSGFSAFLKKLKMLGFGGAVAPTKRESSGLSAFLKKLKMLAFGLAGFLEIFVPEAGFLGVCDRFDFVDVTIAEDPRVG